MLVTKGCILFFGSTKASLRSLLVEHGGWQQVKSGSYFKILIFIGLEYVSFF